VIGKSQSMFLKLFSRGSGIMKEQTLFCDGDNKPIDKKLLTGVELTFIPLLHIKWVHIGTGISLQIELKSAAVTDIKERNTESKQSSTIHSLSETRPEYRAKLAGQLAKISLNRQSLLLPPPTSQPTNEKVEENTSTLSGITATDNVPINDPPVVSHTPRKEYKIPLVDN
jgi:hypothetical protein